MPIRVLSVASEIFPLVKTGGLADVVGTLPRVLAPHDVAITTLVPGYPAVLRALDGYAELLRVDNLFGGPARLLAARAHGLDLAVIDASHLYHRSGSPYASPEGTDWPDNAFRFAALGWVASRIGFGEVPGLVPDVVHAHDWQAALALAYLAYDGRRRPATVLTVHNLSFGGVFPRDLLEALRLPESAFAVDGVEFHGGIGFLKAGLQLADRITAVSPTYAQEIQTPEYGCGLDGLLRYRAYAISGILNGIDTDIWDPANDPHIAQPYTAETLGNRAANKAALQARFGLQADPQALLIGVVSRLTAQKGIDLLADTIETLLAAGAQLAVLGTGEPMLEERFRAMSAHYANRVSCVIGYDEALAHMIQAGADVILVPSRFEPCGLTQLCALRYGALPLVARTGGLADTVIDANDAGRHAGVATGLQFQPPSQPMLAAAIRRVAQLWGDQQGWQRMQRNAMASDVSWSRPAELYAQLYGAIAFRR